MLLLPQVQQETPGYSRVWKTGLTTRGLLCLGASLFLANLSLGGWQGLPALVCFVIFWGHQLHQALIAYGGHLLNICISLIKGDFPTKTRRIPPGDPQTGEPQTLRWGGWDQKELLLPGPNAQKGSWDFATDFQLWKTQAGTQHGGQPRFSVSFLHGYAPLLLPLTVCLVRATKKTGPNQSSCKGSVAALPR